MRLFVALDLAPAVKEAIAKAIGEMRPLAQRHKLNVSWTRAEKLHLTLKFLGETSPDKVADIERALREIAARAKPFEFMAEGAGAFPREKNPRVLWVGVSEPSGSLAALAAAVEAAMEPLGYVRDSRRYTAHLTIGRVKSGHDASAVLAPYREMSFGSTTASNIVLYESVLRPTGAEYRQLATFALT